MVEPTCSASFLMISIEIPESLEYWELSLDSRLSSVNSRVSSWGTRVDSASIPDVSVLVFCAAGSSSIRTRWVVFSGRMRELNGCDINGAKFSSVSV